MKGKNEGRNLKILNGVGKKNHTLQRKLQSFLQGKKSKGEKVMVRQIRIYWQQFHGFSLSIRTSGSRPEPIPNCHFLFLMTSMKSSTIWLLVLSDFRLNLRFTVALLSTSLVLKSTSHMYNHGWVTYIFQNVVDLT